MSAPECPVCCDPVQPDQPKVEIPQTRGVAHEACWEPLDEEPTVVDQIEQWSRHLLHISQHNSMVIGLAKRIQQLANEMRVAVGLEEFGPNDSIPDEEFQACSVHRSGCLGQHTHDI